MIPETTSAASNSVCGAKWAYRWVILARRARQSLHHVERDALVHQETRERVPKIVDAHISQSSTARRMRSQG